MKIFGLIGKSLKHSFSANYFNGKFNQLGLQDYQYRLFELDDVGDMVTLVKNNPNLLGLNVTVPYKSAVIPFINELDESATKVGAVNTLLIDRNGDEIAIKGYNTDLKGFKVLLDPYLKFLNHKKALVLGTGGASKAVCVALNELNLTYQLVSRNPSPHHLSYEEIQADVMAEIGMVVNTTPLGMFPDIESKPILPYHLLDGNSHVLIDLVYNPAITSFMAEGIRMGCKVENGLRMLEAQADAAWSIWNNDQA